MTRMIVEAVLETVFEDTTTISPALYKVCSKARNKQITLAGIKIFVEGYLPACRDGFTAENFHSRRRLRIRECRQ